MKKTDPIDYTTIGIIFNPNSTGDAPAYAEELYEQLKAALPSIPIKLLQTKHAGHGEELAYELGSESLHPVIISVSGDGGYNDVINGAMRAELDHQTQPVCAVRGAGNANDHRRTVREMPLFEAIISKNIKSLDLLKVQVNRDSNQLVRYAHSYAGLGLTPEVAIELNKHDLNKWKELVLVVRTFVSHKPFTILQSNGRKRTYDSMLFGNINQMAKVVTLSKDGSPDDGRFELIATAHRSKLLQLAQAAQAAVAHLKPAARLHHFDFTVVEDMPMQLDGEVLELRKGDEVRVSVSAGSLRTLI